MRSCSDAGASAGGHAGNWASRSANRVVDLGKQQVPLSGREQQLDQHTETNAARAKELVADYSNARTPDERAAARQHGRRSDKGLCGRLRRCHR
mgnify:CR=1 FL=1